MGKMPSVRLRSTAASLKGGAVLLVTLLLLVALSSSVFAVPAPTITTFTPTSAGAGATVTISGTNLTGATAVKFSGVAATSFHVVSATSVTAVVPKTTTGKISVTTPGGTAVSLLSLTFIPAPTITTFTPTTAASGTTVTITGTGFTGATAVKFNGVSATSFHVVSAASITAVVPKTTTGKISVTTPGGTALSLLSLTFIPAPTITTFTPTSFGAGATVTITGTNFTGATAVKFSGVAATSFKVVSSTSITAVVPKTTIGNITVTAPGGTAIALAKFTFVPAPTITAFTPASGGAGTTVTITGTDLIGASAVKFNAVAATSFTVNSATSITAVVPKTTTGKITVTTTGGTATSALSFTFNPLPTIASFTPASAAAGATVTINGTNLTGATAVKFNGVAATSFSVKSAAQITAVVPSTTTGKITVTTPAGTATSATSFTFMAAPTITSFTPTTGAAGAVVTITGTNFTGATSVKFNGIAGTGLTVKSATSITIVVPTTTTGKITVTTPGGTATSVASFTYSGTSVADLIKQGKDKLNQLVTMEPYNATTAKTLLDSAYSLFTQARNLSSTNADANFGLALSDAAKTAQGLIDKYQSSFSDGPAPAQSLGAAVNAFQLFNVADTVKGGNNALNGFVSDYTKGASVLQATSPADIQLMTDIQTDLKNTVMPMLSRVAGYLDTVETYGGSSYTFPVGPTSWRGYTLVDAGDIYLFHGILLAARWALAIPVSYNVNPGTFDWDKSPLTADTNHDGLLSPSDCLPASPFATLTSTGAATLAASKQDMITACSRVMSGIDATLAETSDNHDLIAWHTGASGIDRASLLLTKDFASQLKASMNAATVVTYTGSDGSTFSSNLYLGAWAAHPPADLKAFWPTMEVMRRRNDWAGCYEYDTNPVEKGFPDATMGGLVPGGVTDINQTNKAVWDTEWNGTLVGITTYPANGATNVSTAEWPRPSVTFNGYPPATFSFQLQRYFAGAWRGEYLSHGWNDGSTYYLSLGWDLWPNSSYKMIITDEVAHVSVTRTFTTGADAPF